MLSFFPDFIDQEGHAFYYIGRNVCGEETKTEVLPSAVLPQGQKLCSLDSYRHAGGEGKSLLQ